MGNWFKRNMPGIYKFITDFLGGLSNRPGGQSLRKLLAVGFFWITAILCLRYTDATNLIAVITILCSMITSLVVTYSVSNYKEQKLGLTGTPATPKTDENPPV
jgi:uncharacterized membrane protein